jgi:soluble lytic murein transglycosylase
VWVLVLIAFGAGVAQDAAKLPEGLDPFARQYPDGTTRALQALGQGIKHYSGGAFNLALRTLPDQAAADSTAVADYALFFRGKALRDLGRMQEALTVFSRLETQFPDSPLIARVKLIQAQALIGGGNAAAALAALRAPALPENAETLYRRAQAQELAKNRQQAVELYLQVFAEYVNSDEALLSQKRLIALTPSYLAARNNYKTLLRRAERLIDADRNREARALILKLGSVLPPDDQTRDRRLLLLAQANLNLKRANETLRNLKKVSATDPALHSQAIYLEGVANRRLDRESSFLAARDKGVRLYPDSPFTEELLYSVATYFDSRCQLAQAREAYRSIVGSFPNGTYRQRALWKLAILSFADGQYENALQDFWDYLLAETEADIIAAPAYWMARCYAKIGEPAKAAYLLTRADALGNNSYYGQRAREAESALATAEGAGARSTAFSRDFEEVRKRLDSLRILETPILSPTGAAASAVERASQLAAAGLPEAALDELRSASQRFPEDRAISYVMSRLYAAQDDYLNAITTLRRVVPNYASLSPSALPSQIWELLYPIRHWEPITQAAARSGLDPNLVLGIIRQESALHERARSSADARGLMQILPSTGRKLARQAGVPKYSTSKLYQAETNISLGVHYLASLLRQYDGKTELALAAYNAGDYRVDRWMREFGYEDMAAFVELIPFSETRAYVKQVLTSQAHYKLRTVSASVTAQ